MPRAPKPTWDEERNRWVSKIVSRSPARRLAEGRHEGTAQIGAEICSKVAVLAPGFLMTVSRSQG